MDVIVEVIVPIFAIMLAGYVAARTRLLKENASEALSQFVYYAAGPARGFISLSRTPSVLVESGLLPPSFMRLCLRVSPCSW